MTEEASINFRDYITKENIGIAGGVVTILVGAYIKLFPSAAPVENVVDDIRAMQKSCEEDKVFLRKILTSEANELDRCREDNSKVKLLEERISELEKHSAMSSAFAETTSKEIMGHHGHDSHHDADA